MRTNTHLRDRSAAVRWPLVLCVAALCAVLALLAGPAAAQTPTTAAAGLPVAPGGEGFTVQPGDLVQVGVWREPDLSGDFLVDEGGRVTLPLLGPLDVAGLTPDALREMLHEAYARELRNPSITILPLRRVYVLGEVNRPGLYPIDPTVSLAGAVAIAGGANPTGDLRTVQVVRGGEVVLSRVPAESALAAFDIRSGDQIFVGRRSWFDRNSTFVVSAILSVTSILLTIVR